jgi:dATP pyrophosphohydrolase
MGPKLHESIRIIEGLQPVLHNERAPLAPFFMTKPYKIAQSVLVVIYTPGLDVLLIERVDHPDFWQSVTGSKDFLEESYWATAQREVLEETGIDCTAPNHVLEDWSLENVYEIYPQWRHRYAPGVYFNTERVFGLCVPEPVAVCLSPREHKDAVWLPWREAALRCYSPSNAEAVLHVPTFASAERQTKVRNA